MDWFWTNPVITINGYLFIIIYLALIIAGRRILHIYETKLINSPSDYRLPDTEDDLLFIAWLGDPRNGVCKIVMGPLLEKGFIIRKGKSNLYHTTKKVKAQKTAQEAFLLNYFSKPAALSSLREYFQEQTGPFREKAEQLQLIVTQNVKNKLLRISRIICLTLIALGIYRITGTIEGADGFYLVILITSVFLGNIICFGENRFKRVMFSAKGKDYIKKHLKILSESANKNAQQKWLLKILAGSAVASGLTARNDGDNYVYINLSDSFDNTDSYFDSSFDSDCGSSTDSICSSND